MEEAFHFGFPPDAGAVLVIEVDGPAVGLDGQQEQIVALCRQFGAREVLQAASAERARVCLWKCRKSAVGAIGRLSPSYMIEDGVVPRTRLPHILRRTAEIGQKHQIRIVNVAHAGDGNVHPILLFDERDREQVERAVAAGREILEECIACGGSVTGRARHRRREDRPDGPAVRPRRPGGHAPRPPGVRSGRAAQSGKIDTGRMRGEGRGTRRGRGERRRRRLQGVQTARTGSRVVEYR